MKVKDLMNCRFSTYRCAGDSNRSNGECSLIEWLGNVAVDNEFKIACAREWKKSDEKFYKEIYKKYKVPAASFCGIFPSIRREDADDKHLNGLMVMDIDDYAGDLEELKMRCLNEIDCAFLASKSLSGTGIYVVCLYDTYYEFKDVWRALEQEFKNKVGVKVDTSCKDCSRLRIISYDNNILIKNYKTDIVPFDKILVMENTPDIVDEERDVEMIMTKESYKELVICIDQLVKNGYGKQGFSYYDDKLYDDNKEYDYAKWRRDAWRLGSLENSNIGRQLFRFISKNADRYEGIIDTDNMFDKYIGRCPENNNIGYYFALRDRLSHPI